MDVFKVTEYKEYLFDTVKKIFGIDSPSGYYHAVVKEVEKIATELGYQFEQIEKGCGIITILIRYFGGYSEGVTYAILCMNACSVLLDKIGRPVKFGAPKKEAAKK